MNLLKEFFQVTTQLKLYHWQTKKYSRHKSSDEFVTNISSLIDTYIETHQGKYGRIMLEDKLNITLENINDKNIPIFFDKFKNFLISLQYEPKDSDLSNIRDEMLGLVNQTLYLLTLK
jgi:hypothetical protein